MNYNEMIIAYIQKEIKVLELLDVNAIELAIRALCEVLETEKNVYTFGNGGSAATASHFANDFNKGVSEFSTKKFRFICLNDNMATVMAIANDIGYEEVFRSQLDGRIKPGDLVIAISGSGNSPNIIKAVQYAREQGNKIIGITGYDGGELKRISDISLHVPVEDMQITEDVHMIFDHLMMSVISATLAGDNR